MSSVMGVAFGLGGPWKLGPQQQGSEVWLGRWEAPGEDLTISVRRSTTSKPPASPPPSQDPLSEVLASAKNLKKGLVLQKNIFPLLAELTFSSSLP